MIRITTYNCHGMKNSIVDLFELCKHNDLTFLQEIWLFKFELNLISTIHPEFEAYGISTTKDSDEIINGRPYGGLAILIRKQYRPICDFQSFDDSRLLGVTISSSVDKYCFINVYMPYQHDNNYETFMECIGKLSATIEDSDMCNLIILGDFNSAVDTPFETELLEFCSAYELTISDYQRYGRGSDSSRMLAMRITVLLGSAISFVVIMFILKLKQLKYWTNCLALIIYPYR